MTAVEGVRPLPVSHVLNFAKPVLNGPSRLLTPSGEASRAQLSCGLALLKQIVARDCPLLPRPVQSEQLCSDAEQSCE
jgi:hypothetical protein